MKSVIFVPAILAACAAGAGILPLPRSADSRGAFDDSCASTSGGLSLCAELARSAWPTFEIQSDGVEAPNGRSYRFEFRNDGSGPRYFRNGKEVEPGDRDFPDDPSDLFGDGRFQVPPGFDRFFGQLGEDNPLEELFRQFREESRPGERGGDRGESDGDADSREMLERLMRRMRDGRGAGAPTTDEYSSRYGKHHLSSLAEWRPLIRAARQATARVVNGDRQVALATIVSPDGYALTKASEIARAEDGIECELFDGRIVKAEVIDKLDSYDLALIRLDASELAAIAFADTPARVGTLVAAVTPAEDPGAIGVISVPPRNLNDKSKGYLGIMMDMRTRVPKGVPIAEVAPGGAAQRAGIRNGDVVISVNGSEINYPTQLQKIITSLEPDEKISVGILRGDENLTVELSLGSRADANLSNMLDMTARMGSNLSENSRGYPTALQCDLGIDAEDCGGPVVNADGAVVGINIARAERVSTYMIPAETLRSVLTDVKSGKFALTKDPATLKSDLREAEREIDRARQALQEAEKRQREAAEALEKAGGDR